MGSDCVEAINAIAGERCSPHPHNFTDRLIRPGDQAFFDIIQSFMGYRTWHYRTFNVGRATSSQRTAYKKAREWMDVAIDLLRKDIDLGLDAGRKFEVPLPLASATRDLIQSMMGSGMTEQDFATLLVQQARSSGIELTPEDVAVGDGLA